MYKAGFHERLMLVVLCGTTYFLMNVPVQMTGILPSFAGIKNFLPSTLGLFFGVYGVSGCIVGCLLSALLVNHSVSTVMYECVCIAVVGLGMFYGWHFRNSDHRIHFKAGRDYARFIFLLAVLSGLCCDVRVSLAYFLTGMFIGVPVNILLSSLLYIEPVMPRWCSYDYDAVFCLMQGAESLDDANEMIEESAMSRGITMKRVFEIQSSLEEILIRVLKAVPDAKVHVMLIFGDAISARMHYEGKKYNPFLIEKGEDEIDIMSLKIIKHRALRASFIYSEGVNKIHIVV